MVYLNYATKLPLTFTHWCIVTPCSRGQTGSLTVSLQPEPIVTLVGGHVANPVAIDVNRAIQRIVKVGAGDGYKRSDNRNIEA